ncbi:MAG: ATP-dependent Clp protease adaptor ClpS [Spirochaetes bacterium]|nr:ATP-dependent Clp protease adaptor ClpS [Spirochaetota bacterium]
MSVSQQSDGQTEAIEETTPVPQEPEEYRVILLNDDFTTMEFVVSILMTIFHKTLPEATKIMIDVHRKGRGNVGEYSYDIAATKINQVHLLARQMGFPLKCTMERV